MNKLKKKNLIVISILPISFLLSCPVSSHAALLTENFYIMSWNLTPASTISIAPGETGAWVTYGYGAGIGYTAQLDPGEIATLNESGRFVVDGAIAKSHQGDNVTIFAGEGYTRTDDWLIPADTYSFFAEIGQHAAHLEIEVSLNPVISHVSSSHSFEVIAEPATLALLALGGLALLRRKSGYGG